MKWSVAPLGARAVIALMAALGLALTIGQGCALSSKGTGPQGLARCANAQDCPGTGDPCSVPTCSPLGLCGKEAISDGISTTQISGDCLLSKCISGVTEKTPDPSDVDDANPCTADDCSAATPHTPLADGTACVLGAGTGTCVSGACAVPCNVGQPCDDKNPCSSDSCDEESGFCVFAPLDGDAPIANPDPHDCKKPVCIAGVLSQANDDTEAPDDGKACTVDTCLGGQPTHTLVGSGMNAPGCAAPQQCDGSGNCVNCTVPSDCGPVTECSTPTCTGGVCDPGYHPSGEVVVMQTPQDCQVRECTGNSPTAAPIGDPNDIPDDMDECTIDSCVGTTPSHVIDPGGSCMNNKFCSAGGACVDCFVSANCPANQNCNGGSCFSCLNGVQDPGETQIDCGNLTCGECAGVACGAGCAATLTCVDATCCKAASCADCTTCGNGAGQCAPVADGTNDGGCVAPAHCQSGSCVGKMQGEACSASTECATGNCVDGFCCSGACGTSCQACSHALTNQANGTCADIVHGTDPAMECPSVQVCCGAGVCGAAGCP